MHKSPEQFEQATLKLFKIWSFIYDSFLPRLLYFNSVYGKTIDAIVQYDAPLHAPQSRFLDAACGTGEILLRLSSRYPHTQFAGIDFSRHMLEKAAAKTRMCKNVTLKQANIRYLPYPNCSFDMALCSDALHHFADPSGALRELARVVKPHGTLILTDPVCDTLLQSCMLEIFVKPWDRPKKYYATHEVSLLLHAAGFHPTKILTHHMTSFFIAERE